MFVFINYFKFQYKSIGPILQFLFKLQRSLPAHNQGFMTKKNRN